MTMPTKEQVEAVRHGRGDTIADVRGVLALCDLADAVLSAPVVELEERERAIWGDCPTCARQHGRVCDSSVAWKTVCFGVKCQPHDARLAAAPTHVRMVPADAPGKEER